MNFLSLFKRNLIYKLKKKIDVDNDDLSSMSLDQLFHHYGSDKAEIFRLNKKKGHGYSKFYLKHLQKLKKNQLNILEIGSYSGASAAAFSKYLPNSQIFCLDINVSKFRYSSEKIKVYGVDINNKSKVIKILEIIFLDKKFKNFDIIIDDGSHKLSEILNCINFFFKYLKSGGIFVIEDYMLPNYFKNNKDVDDIFVDHLLKKLRNNEFFKSNFFNKEDQKYLISSINKIDNYKGNLDISDICFIEKK